MDDDITHPLWEIADLLRSIGFKKEAETLDRYVSETLRDSLCSMLAEKLNIPFDEALARMEQVRTELIS